MGTLIDIEGRTLTPDNTLSESYTEEAMVTEHPIANDADPTDHRQVLPRKLSLELLFTETPLAPNGLTEIDYGEVALRAGGAPKIITGPRGWQALYFIRTAADAGTMTYSSKRLGQLVNLMLENMTYTVVNRRDLRITLELKQVVFAQSLRVDLPPEVVRKGKPQVCPNVNTGDQGKFQIYGPEQIPEGPQDISLTLNAIAGGKTDSQLVDMFNFEFGTVDPINGSLF